jgi:exonuclease SbcD
MKKPLLIASTDWHLKRENIPQIINLFKQKCELAVKLGVKQLVCTGDVFDSRIAQRQDVLTAFNDILEMLVVYDLEMVIIPGNHDKTLYTEKQSFLDPFKNHRKLLLVNMAGVMPLGDFRIVMLPFFSEEVWIKNFEELDPDGFHIDFNDGKKYILFTHIAVTGSRNNDGKLVSSSISVKMFEKFFKVFSGHYHDQQKIGKNFYHIPSIQQNNFGEDEDKGFTVIYDDGSHELYWSDFKKYINVEFDLNDLNYLDIVTSKKLYEQSGDNIRFTIRGTENQLKVINKQEFELAGINIRTINKDIEESIKFANDEIVELNASLIADEFSKFCDKNGLDEETGLKYLKQILKWN